MSGDDGTSQIAYFMDCTDGRHGWVWLEEPQPGVDLPTPADLAAGARERVEALVPQPAWHTPADTNPNHHAYAQILDLESGRGAFEVLVDPLSRTVYPEHGPNMMWNSEVPMTTFVGTLRR